MGHPELKVRPMFVVRTLSYSALFTFWSGAGNTKGGSITVLLTSCLTGLD
jgi:hypothetical protein